MKFLLEGFRCSKKETAEILLSCSFHSSNLTSTMINNTMMNKHDREKVDIVLEQAGVKTSFISGIHMRSDTGFTILKVFTY